MKRILTAACAALLIFAVSAHAAEIRTGHDLVNACRNYVSIDGRQDNTATRAPHPCRTFLQGFFVSLISRDAEGPSLFVEGSLRTHAGLPVLPQHGRARGHFRTVSPEPT